MLTDEFFTVDMVDRVLSHAEEERRHDGVDIGEVAEEEDAQLKVVSIVVALARDSRRVERLGIKGGEAGEDEVGRSLSDVSGRKRRLGRINCRSALCRYDIRQFIRPNGENYSCSIP